MPVILSVHPFHCSSHVLQDSKDLSGLKSIRLFEGWLRIQIILRRLHECSQGLLLLEGKRSLQKVRMDLLMTHRVAGSSNRQARRISCVAFTAFMAGIVL